MATQSWIEYAKELLLGSLDPIPQELNQLDWKLALSEKDERLHNHLSAFANTQGGGFLVFGVDKDGHVVGIDKALLAVEVFGMPPPEFIEGDNYFRVILYSPRPFGKMTKEERIRACYFHCCLRHIQSEKMTNTTLRDRFKIKDENYPIVSKVISDTVEAQFIKAGDPRSKSRKHAFYVPFWA